MQQTVVPPAVAGEKERVITWTAYLWDPPKTASLEEIKAVEAKLNVTFPDDYRVVVMAHQGQTPNPSLFRFYSAEEDATDATPLNTLFHFSPDVGEREGDYNILAMYESLRDRLPEGVVPIGEDPGGNYIAFDFRVQLEKADGTPGPCVVYLDHEAEDDDGKLPTIFVADSFTRFLGQLRSEEEIEVEFDEQGYGEEEAEDEDELAESEDEDGEELEGEGPEDGGSVAHVAKRRRINEDGARLSPPTAPPTKRKMKREKLPGSTCPT